MNGDVCNVQQTDEPSPVEDISPSSKRSPQPNSNSRLLDANSESLETEFKVEGSQIPIKGRLSLLSNSDDSFELFLPTTAKNEKSNLTKHNSLKGGKQKNRKTLERTRTCPYFSSSKGARSYFKPSKTQEEKDLELALARSLAEVSGNPQSTTVHGKVQARKITPAEPPLRLKNWTGQNPKKKTLCILKKRTPDDREKLVAQKIAAILLGTKKISSEDKPQKRICPDSLLLEKFFNKESTLWELSKLSEDGCFLSDFYVESLKNYFKEMKPLSQTSEMNPESPDILVDDSKDSSSGFFKLHSNDSVGNNSDGEKQFCNENKSSPIRLETYKKYDHYDTSSRSLNLLSDDWSTLYCKTQFSDLEILLDNRTIPGHKLVLSVRCPLLLKEITEMSNPSQCDFTKYNAKAVMTFLLYLYSGRCENISQLSIFEKSELWILCKKYKVDYLESLMSSDSDLNAFYDEDTCSPPHSCEKSKANILVDLTSPTISRNAQVSSSDLTDELAVEACAEKSEKELDISRPFRDLITENSTVDIFANDDTNQHQSITNTSHSKRKLFEVSPDTQKSNTNVECDSQSVSLSKKVCTEPVEVINLDSESGDEFHAFVKSSPPLSPSNSKSSDNIGIITLDDEEFPSYHFDCDSGGNDLKSNPTNMTPEPAPSESKNLAQTRPSLEAYLQSSLPSMAEDMLDQLEKQSQPIQKSTPLRPTARCTVATPNSSIIFSSPIASSPLIDIISPKQESSLIINEDNLVANCSAMLTPQLKAQLAKYGLKQNLDKRKAKALLKYINEQLMIEGKLAPTTEDFPSTSTDNQEVDAVSSDSDPDPFDLSSEKKSHYSFLLEETLFDENEDNHNSSSTDANDLKSILLKFLKRDPKLHVSVLMFKPLLLKAFHKTLKEHGICCSLPDLMDSLDELCIVYRVEGTGVRNKRPAKTKLKKIDNCL